MSSQKSLQATRYLSSVLTLLRESFDLEELNLLAFELGVDFDDLGGQTKTAKARELVNHMARLHRIPDLIEKSAQQRPNQNWPPVPKTLTEAQLILPSIPKPKTKERRHQLILLRRVYEIWIEGFLDQSMKDSLLIELRKETSFEVVDKPNPWNTEVTLPEKENHTLPDGEHIANTFDEMDRSMLILGEPGSGKTVTLLELAREMVTRAELDPTEPIPVILNLSTWNGDSLSEWIVLDLNKRYRIPKRSGRSWVESNDLLLLLDGLDEVHSEKREACVSAINDYLTTHGLTGVAVCCRTQIYESLLTRLQMETAVILQPLTPSQINKYLTQLDSNFNTLQTQIQKDANLREMAASPLMLNLMLLTYRDISNGKETSSSHKAYREKVFSGYVKRMYAQRGRKGSYSFEQTIYWLNSLAQKMSQHEPSTFYLEELQPSWLKKPTDRRLFYRRVKIIVILLFVIGMFSYTMLDNLLIENRGTAENVLNGFQISLWQSLIIILMVATSNSFSKFLSRTLSVALTTGLAIGLTAIFANSLDKILPTKGFVPALIFGLAASWAVINDSRYEQIKIVPLNWSWKNGLWGAVVGLIGLIGLIFSTEINIQVVMGLIFLFGMSSILPLAILGSHEPFTNDITPNQGIKQSGYNALTIGLLALISNLIIGLLLGFVTPKSGDMFLSDLVGGLMLGLELGLPIAILLALSSGGTSWIQHLLLRYQLHRSGDLPWNLIHFLDYAAQCVFVRRVGGGYLFIHQMMQEFFADSGKLYEGSVEWST